MYAYLKIYRFSISSQQNDDRNYSSSASSIKRRQTNHKKIEKKAKEIMTRALLFSEYSTHAGCSRPISNVGRFIFLLR